MKLWRFYSDIRHEKNKFKIRFIVLDLKRLNRMNETVLLI